MNSPKSGNFSRLYTGLLILLSLIAAGLFLIVTKNFGIGISPDSVVYFSIARQIQNGESISVTLFPPLYSAILAGLSSLFGIALIDAARVLQAGISGVTVLLSGILFGRHLPSSVLFKLIAASTVMTAYALVSVYQTAWTDPLFVIQLLLYLILLEDYLGEPKKVTLLLVALTVGLGCLTRYAGVSLVFIGLFSILLLSKKQLLGRLIDGLIFGTVSSAPICAWMIRNYLISGTFTGVRPISAYSYWDNLRAAFNTIFKWYLPGIVRSNWIWMAAFLLVVGAAIFFYYRQVLKKERPDLRWLIPYLILIVGYTLFMIISAKTSVAQVVDLRYMSPLFIPIHLLALFFFYGIVSAIGQRFAFNFAGIVACVLLAAWAFFPYQQTRASVISQMNMGLGYTNKYFTNSETIAYFKQNLGSCSVYTNGQDVIEFYTGKQVNVIPLKTNGPTVVTTLALLKDQWPPEQSVCVVWFDQITWRTYLFTADELKSITQLQSEVRLADGTVYYLSKFTP